MYYGRIWLRVNPAVGIPVFLGAVAATALIVHIGILTHTSWYPAYLEGGAMKKTASVAISAGAASATAGGTPSVVINVAQPSK
jgi:light-harvesting protein B-800-850 alpha chain